MDGLGVNGRSSIHADAQALLQRNLNSTEIQFNYSYEAKAVIS